MYLKLALVGHQRRIKLINDIVKTYFKEIETIDIEFESLAQSESIKSIIKNQEQYLDGILFTGKAPYQIINSKMIPSIPWDYLHNDESQLLRSLLDATLLHKYEVSKISIDSYEKEKVLKTFNEIGINNNSVDAFIWEETEYDEKFLEKLELFHSQNYYNQKVSCCFTGFSAVYESLIKKNIPCISLDPTLDTIINILTNFELKQEALINKKSQLVILSIEIDLPNEYSLINENEYETMLEKVKVTKEIYLFAQKIQSTLTEIGDEGYLLFCTKSILETETNNIENFDLLSTIAKNTCSTISVGIGYGITAREAKYNATIGMKKAQKKGGNKAFVVYGGKNIIEPVSPTVINPAESEPFIDNIFHNIAVETGLSINTIFKLHCISNENSNESFTSMELAKSFGITPRSMNRIIDRLEKYNHIKIVGKKVLGKSGRPSRIIKLLF